MACSNIAVKEVDSVYRTKMTTTSQGSRVVNDRLSYGSQIGTGSNGTIVYEGTYQRRSAAVKRFLSYFYNFADKEINTLVASDSHPNIIRLYGWETDSDFTYLALERCDYSLFDLVKENKHPELWESDEFSSPELLKLMKDIVVGLASLHDLGIIHRDMKPQNVLILNRNELCVKVSDMGISKRLAPNKSSLGHDATVSGTYGWRSPEQIPRGTEQICEGRQTKAMDVFSLGCVLFFFLTKGRHPFGDPVEREANVASNTKKYQNLLEHNAEAENLFSKLLSQQPEQRPEAKEVLLHPFFWNSEKRMSFIKDASDWVESESKKGRNEVIPVLEYVGQKAFSESWDTTMDPAFISHMNRSRKKNYNKKKARDLLRVIRNTIIHYRDLPMDIQGLLGALPEGVDYYFRRKFPKLLMEVYDGMHHHCKGEDWFRKYMES